MLESFTTDKFDYKKLSLEEQEKRGILGRLVGVIADTANPTRNGRKYSAKLWEKVFNDPLMQEKINNRCLFGELGHPADREETDMEKIALCLAEPPKKGKDGKLYGVFDILSTPNGKILKTLCDYGCNIGVSSRGSGDLITDYDGNESVDENTYDCQGWDAVLVPAVKEARLQYVTEALDTKKYNKTLRNKLEESLSKASEDDKKVMKEGLDNLGITLNEDDLHNVFRKDAKAQYKNWDRRKDRINRDRAEIAKDYSELAKEAGKEVDPERLEKAQDIIAGTVKPFKYDKGDTELERQNYPYYITVYNARAYYHPEEGGYYQAGWDPAWSEGYNSFEEAEEALKSYWKGNSSTEVEFNPDLPTDDDNYAYSEDEADYRPIYDNKDRLIGLDAEGKYIGQGQKIYIEPNKRYLSAAVGYQMYESLDEARYAGRNYPFALHFIKADGTDGILVGSKNLDDSFISSCINQAHNVIENPWMTDKEKYRYLDSMYIADDNTQETDLRGTADFEDYVDNLMSELSSRIDSKGLKDESLNEDIESSEILKPGKEFTSKSGHKIWIDSVDAWFSPYDGSPRIAMNYHYKLSNGEEGESRCDTEDLFNMLKEGLYEPINIEDQNTAVDNNEAMVEELQKSLGQINELKGQLVELQEKLSVSYAKESKLEEQLSKQKSAISNLTKSAQIANVLKNKVVSLQESEDTLKKQLTESSNTISKLNRVIEVNKERRVSLQESISAKEKSNSELNEQLKSLEKKNVDLNESLMSIKKDMEIKKSDYSKKIEQSNKLVEKYKRIARASVDKYIELQAERLGVSGSEIKNRLPESYSFDDIDRACQSVEEYKYTINRLPFNTMLNEHKLKVKATNTIDPIVSNIVASEDDVDEQLLSLAKMK